MGLVAAICTNCGAGIETDPSHEAGICPFCGTAYITEKAINNYNNTFNIQSATINIEGPNIENLLKRAMRFEADGDTEKASEYYNRALDIDADNTIALRGLERLALLDHALRYEHNLDYEKASERYNRVLELDPGNAEALRGLERTSRPLTKKIAGVEVSVETYEEVARCVADEKKIAAIKAFRAASGLGLKEAKEAVEYEWYGGPKPDITGGAHTQQKSEGGCYIATCAYGSYDCPQVWTLRRWRDGYLAKRTAGRAFIRAYYAISPKLVSAFGTNQRLVAIVRSRLDRFVAKLNSQGYASTPYQDRG